MRSLCALTAACACWNEAHQQRGSRSSKWSSVLIEGFLWQRANTRLEELEEQQNQALCIWDGSVLEKAESEKVEGLCSVRSSKAKRLRKLKPGLFNQLSGPPIVVRGMEWTGVILAGLKHAPTVVTMKWWSRKGQYATTRASGGTRVALPPTPGAWGERVLHVAGSRVCESQLVSSSARGRGSFSHALAKRPSGVGCSWTGTQDLAPHPWQATPRTTRRSMMPACIAHD